MFETPDLEWQKNNVIILLFFNNFIFLQIPIDWILQFSFVAFD